MKHAALLGVRSIVVGGGLLVMLIAFAGCSAEAVQAPPAVTLDPSTAQGAADLEQLARTDAIALLEGCREHYRAHYRNFSCLFRKQERVEGVLKSEQHIRVRFREEPFAIVMHWVKNDDGAARVIYRQGRDNGMMLVQPAGFLLGGLTLKKEPWGDDARKRALRPVTQFGYRNGLDSLLETCRLARQRGELKTSFGGYAEIGGRKALILERILPSRPDYPAARTVIYIDLEYLVPTGILGYDAEGQLIASYLYEDLQFNQPFTDETFTPGANGMSDPG